MKKITTDPRVIRTRNLIIDSLIRLSKQKNFESITIKDITSEATVNRATFYYHFTDKYDLLEQTLKYRIMNDVLNQLTEINDINADSIIVIFLSITEFLNNLLIQCSTSYVSLQKLIESNLKKELQEFFYTILKPKFEQDNTEFIDKLQTYSALLTWSIYGAVIDCQFHKKDSPEEYAKKITPYIFNGMNSLMDSIIIDT
ncbi:TetR/AcrR family transcriptional regulator [Vagococcus sp.]|uniref:TetR/AcrR family transcriptional regulator n=1 Tax=Vagococcus sp. TaxID=1933889 RepID=UPI002FC62720